MEWRRFGNNLVVRVDPEEEICQALVDLAAKEKIALAEIHGLGAVKEFTTGVFDPATKQYYAIHFQGVFEIVSLTGPLTQKDGKPYLHVHMSAGDEKGNVFGGHLNRAVVSATAEIVVRQMDGVVERQMCEKIGLNLFSFQ